MITNFHNVENSAVTIISLTKTDTLGTLPLKRETLKFSNSNYMHSWIKHPDYDIAILPLIPIMESIYSETKKFIYYVSFTKAETPDLIKVKNLSAIEALLMVGYPKGYGDAVNNYPIVRTGTTATPVWSDFENKKEFLLDIPMYAGSSGSPVVLLNDGSYTSNGGLILGGKRVFLMGIATQSIDLTMQNAGNGIQLENPLNIAVVLKSSVLEYFTPFITKKVEEEMTLLNKTIKQ